MRKKSGMHKVLRSDIYIRCNSAITDHKCVLERLNQTHCKTRGKHEYTRFQIVSHTKSYNKMRHKKQTKLFRLKIKSSLNILDMLVICFRNILRTILKFSIKINKKIV